MKQTKLECRRHDTLFPNDFHYNSTHEDCLAQLQRRPWQPNECACVSARWAFNVFFECVGDGSALKHAPSTHTLTTAILRVC